MITGKLNDSLSAGGEAYFEGYKFGYETGLNTGRAEIGLEMARMIAMIIERAGGEVVISRQAQIGVVRLTLEREDDLATGAMILRVRPTSPNTASSAPADRPQDHPSP